MSNWSHSIVVCCFSMNKIILMMMQGCTSKGLIVLRSNTTGIFLVGTAHLGKPTKDSTTATKVNFTAVVLNMNNWWADR